METTIISSKSFSFKSRIVLLIKIDLSYTGMILTPSGKED